MAERAPGPSLAPLSEPMSVEGDSTYAELAVGLAPRFQLAHKLGAGGMGAVWAAKHDAWGDVVIKVMHAHLDEKNHQRLRLEGQALAKIRSPHVVRVFDSGVVAGQPYLVMERLHGQDVDGLLDQGPVSWQQTVQIAKDVLRGLAVVHAAKIVHRDLKPGNIFVCRGDRGAVLLDFGVAKLLQRVTGIDPLDNATKVGSTVGTPRFLSPEQARARPVDHRADIYSLGVVLFHMLTGHRLFDVKGLSALLLAHVKEPPRPPSLLVPEVPAALDRVILRALAKRPEQRFPDAHAFIAALEAVEADPRGILHVPVDGSTQILIEDDPPAAQQSARGIPKTHPLPVTRPVAQHPAPEIQPRARHGEPETRPMARHPEPETRSMARQPESALAQPDPATQPMRQRTPIADTVLETPAIDDGPRAVPIPTAPMEIGAHTPHAPEVYASRTNHYVIIAVATLAVFVVAIVLTIALMGDFR